MIQTRLFHTGGFLRKNSFCSKFVYKMLDFHGKSAIIENIESKNVSSAYESIIKELTDEVAKLKAELSDVMAMCGAKNIGEISSDMLF